MPCFSNASLISRLRDRPTMNCLPATVRTRRTRATENSSRLSMPIVERVENPRLEFCISGELIEYLAQDFGDPVDIFTVGDGDPRNGVGIILRHVLDGRDLAE